MSKAEKYLREQYENLIKEIVEERCSDIEYELKCYEKAIRDLGLEDRVYREIARIKRLDSIWESI